MNFEILGVFFSALTAAENYPSGDSGGFPVPYWNAIILKTKNFYEFFVPFMESPWKYKYFQK